MSDYILKLKVTLDDGRSQWPIVGRFDETQREAAIEWLNELVAEDKHYILLVCPDGYLHRQQPRKDRTRPIFQFDPDKFTH